MTTETRKLSELGWSDTDRPGSELQAGISAGRIRPWEETDEERTKDWKIKIKKKVDQVFNVKAQVLAIQISAVSSGALDWSQLKMVRTNYKVDRYTVQPRDLVLSLREPFRATYIDEIPDDWFNRLDQDTRRGVRTWQESRLMDSDERPALCVTGATARFRVDPDRRHDVDPAYLAWLFDQPQMQTRADNSASGNTIKFISLKEVRELSVPLPETRTQKQIAEIWRLQRKMAALENQRRMHQEEYNRGVSQRLFSGQVRINHNAQHEAH